MFGGKAQGVLQVLFESSIFVCHFVLPNVYLKFNTPLSSQNTHLKKIYKKLTVGMAAPTPPPKKKKKQTNHQTNNTTHPHSHYIHQPLTQTYQNKTSIERDTT